MPLPLTELILVRHSETAWNAESRIQGHRDIPLNARGLAQAAALGQRLGAERFDAVYSSDLQRALQTALPLVRHRAADIRLEPRLRERHLGVLEGLNREQAILSQPVAWQVLKTRQADAPLAGGESLGIFFARAVGLLRELVERHAGHRVLLVTHGGVLDAAYRYVKALPLDALRDFPVHNASRNILHYDGEWRVALWGDVSHLSAETSPGEH